MRWDMFDSAELLSVDRERAETFFWAESMVEPSRPEQRDDFAFLQRTESVNEWRFRWPLTFQYLKPFLQRKRSEIFTLLKQWHIFRTWLKL